MSPDLDVLTRAHDLFAGLAQRMGEPAPAAQAATPAGLAGRTGALAAAYQAAAAAHGAQRTEAARTDAALVRLLADAAGDHDDGRRNTAAVLAAARADTAVADNPIAARELLQRRVIRLRAQRQHVLAARRRARRRRAELLALRYGRRAQRDHGGSARAEHVVRAALTRLGRPYVWGATGPDRFDCSGLVQWAYAQAGVSLQRTTYDQINEGVPVARSHVRPGDLVFPHTGHVQMAIGHNMVIEAPYAGASVQISPLGSAVAIRRPM